MTCDRCCPEHSPVQRRLSLCVMRAAQPQRIRMSELEVFLGYLPGRGPG